MMSKVWIRPGGHGHCPHQRDGPVTACKNLADGWKVGWQGRVGRVVAHGCQRRFQVGDRRECYHRRRRCVVHTSVKDSGRQERRKGHNGDAVVCGLIRRRRRPSQCEQVSPCRHGSELLKCRHRDVRPHIDEGVGRNEAYARRVPISACEPPNLVRSVWGETAAPVVMEVMHDADAATECWQDACHVRVLGQVGPGLGNTGTVEERAVTDDMAGVVVTLLLGHRLVQSCPGRCTWYGEHGWIAGG